MNRQDYIIRQALNESIDNFINEDRISRALNESIDEFLLEEGWWDTAKNLADKAWNGVKTVGNWAKNGLAMYMDNATNGEWNKKYNVHAKGKGFMVGCHYFEKWLKQRYYKLQDLVYGEYYGNKTYYYTINQYNQKSYFNHDWRNNCYTLKTNNGKTYVMSLDNYGMPDKITETDINGRSIEFTGRTHNKEDRTYEFYSGGFAYPFKVYYGEDDATPEEYVSKQCTPQNFLQQTKNVLENGEVRDKIVSYITEIQTYAKSKDMDYSTLISMFDISKFYKKYGDLSSIPQTNSNATQQANTNNNNQSTTPNNNKNNNSTNNKWADTSEMPNGNSNASQPTSNAEALKAKAEKERKNGNFADMEETWEGKQKRKTI